MRLRSGRGALAGRNVRVLLPLARAVRVILTYATTECKH